MAYNSLKILQINTARCMKTVSELRYHVEKENIQIMAIQEPYTIKGKITSFGKAARVVSGEKIGEKAWAGIVIFDPKIVVMKIESLSDTHITCAQVDTGYLMFYLVSGYFQYSDPIEPYIARIKNIVRQLHGRKIIICLDANAHSPVWFSDELTVEGEVLEDAIMELNLYVANEPDNPKTYSRPGGEANIDVTLISEPVVRLLHKWGVKEGWSSSDHNAITFEVRHEYKQVTSYEKSEMIKFITQKANWERFDASFMRKVPVAEECQSSHDVLELVRGLRRAMVEACKESMPKRGKTKICARWWTDELTIKKRDVHKLRRNYQKAKKRNGIGGGINAYKREYYESKKKYDNLIYRTRLDSWRTFITNASREPWGYAYKLSCNKLKGAQVLNSIKKGNEYTLEWKDTAEELLNGLFCYDDPESDSGEQRTIRENEDVDLRNTEDEVQVEHRDIEAVISKMKIGKAPGWDGIEVVVVKRAWKLNSEIFIKIFRGCWKFRFFPNEWKKAMVVTLLKTEEKPKSDPSSYRPVCLLPVMSKLMEGLILSKMQPKSEAKLSDKQFGFRPGRSTEDALHEFLKISRQTEDIYALGIFLDISNAFNNLWWPAIIKAAKAIDVSKQIIDILKDYLRNRQVIFRTDSGSIRRTVNKGCPQGSVLGPQLWNIVFDELVKILEEEGLDVVVFADDVVIIIKGNSREEIELKCQRALNVAQNWCSRNKMKLSETKTVMMMLKGKLDTKRPPQVKLLQKSIKMVEEFKYLGVTFHAGTKGLKAGRHLQNVSNKSKRMFTAIKGVAKREWGIGYKALRIIYKGLFLALTTYVASVWIDLVNIKDWSKLESAQRHALIGVTKAYQSISLDAVQVIAGELPIRMEAIRRCTIYKLRRGMKVTIRGIDRVIDKGNKLAIRIARKEATSYLISEWQEKWERSNKGRTTYKFLPSVSNRRRMYWIEMTFYVTQALSGHGDFNEKLMSFNLTDNSKCLCGLDDNSRHLIMDCQLYDEDRELLKNKCREAGAIWPPVETQFMTKEIFPEFKEFVRIALRKKELLRLESS